VRYVPEILPRDVGALVRTLRPAVRVLRSRRYRDVVGSGSISLAFLPLAPLLGLRGHFIECATRTDGPSITGRALAAVPGVRVYTQHAAWAGRRWLYRGSVFDNYEPGPPVEGDVRLKRIVVTVGMNPFPFRRLFEHLVGLLPADAEVVWQAGFTDTTGLPIDAHDTLPPHELDEAIRRADVVIAHAGTGSALQALDNGKVPVLVSRRAALGEQTDEHQPLLAAELDARGLCVPAEVEELTLDKLLEAARRTARRRVDPPHFDLV
jgi:UDP-N-acetylglucosamine transferase subunit ALG13